MTQAPYRKYILLILIAFAGILNSVFWAYPDPVKLKDFRDPLVMEALFLKKGDVFNDMKSYHEESHEAKMSLRITIPVIMQVFDLNEAQLYRVQLAAGVLMYIVASILLFSIVDSYVVSLLFILGMSCTWFGRSYLLDTIMLLDAFVYLLILVCLLFRNNPFVLIPAVVAIFFADERGILALSIVWLFSKIVDHKGVFNWKSIFKLDKPSVILYLGIIVAFALRIYISHKYDYRSHVLPISVLYYKIKFLNSGVWTGLGSFIALILITIGYAVSKRSYLFSLALLGITAGMLLATAIVLDTTRSAAYLFPLVFVCIYYLRHINVEVLNIFLVIAIANMLAPARYQMGEYQTDFYPAYANMLQWAWEHLLPIK